MENEHTMKDDTDRQLRRTRAAAVSTPTSQAGDQSSLDSLTGVYVHVETYFPDIINEYQQFHHPSLGWPELCQHVLTS